MSDTPGRADGETMSVLVVDDDEASREYLGALLDALGFSVEGALTDRYLDPPSYRILPIMRLPMILPRITSAT